MEKNFLELDSHLKDLIKGKIVVITGAGSGLGKAIALGLPYAGAKVGVLDLNPKSVEEVTNQINSEFKDSAFGMVASVTDETQLEKVYSEIANGFGKVDVLINCAGIAKLNSIDQLTPREIKLANDVNMNGYFLNAHFASKQMIEKKQGSIINISSASARSASPNSSLYGVAKEAQCMMTRSWAMDLGKHNITVNALLCGDLFENPVNGTTLDGVINGAWMGYKTREECSGEACILLTQEACNSYPAYNYCSWDEGEGKCNSYYTCSGFNGGEFGDESCTIIGCTVDKLNFYSGYKNVMIEPGSNINLTCANGQILNAVIEENQDAQLEVLEEVIVNNAGLKSFYLKNYSCLDFNEVYTKAKSILGPLCNINPGNFELVCSRGEEKSLASYTKSREVIDNPSNLKIYSDTVCTLSVNIWNNPQISPIQLTC